MDLSERISEIIKANGLTQRKFAESISVTEGFISQVLKKGSRLSRRTASIIEERYGYSKNWILTGEGPKMAENASNLTQLQKTLVDEIERMNTNDLMAVFAYIKTFNDVKNTHENPYETYKDSIGEIENRMALAM